MTNTRRLILPLSIVFIAATLLLLSLTLRHSFASGELGDFDLYEGNNRAAQTTSAVIADFESGTDPVDWFEYSGGGGSVAATYGSINSNGAVSVTFAIGGGQWGGFGINYLNSGVEQDWSAFEGISLDVFGQNSGAIYTFEIQDKEGGGDAARYTTTFTDDFTGARKIILPFDSFAWGVYQEGSPANDGFQTTAVNAWAMPLPGASTALVIEHIQLVNLDSVQDFEAALTEPPWFRYSGGGASATDTVVTISDSDGMALPGQAGDNMALDVTANATVGWAGFGSALDPVADWSGEDGLTFWYYGNNLGTTHEIEIQTANDGNHRAMFDDNFTGWRQIALPFSQFGSGPFNLTEITNWVFVLDGTNGSFKLDALSTYNSVVPTPAAPTLGFSPADYSIVEGGSAAITVSLDISSTSDVTVTVNSADGTATAGSDYTAVMTQQVVIPAGSLSSVFTVTTTDDADRELPESVMLTLTNTNGVAVGTDTATLLILDNEPAPLGTVMIDDFEDNDASDWADAGGNNAGCGKGVLDDRPYAGTYYLSVGCGGQGTSSGWYGGMFKQFPDTAQIIPPTEPIFSVWVYNQSNATVDGYTLEITIREDLDGNGWTNGQEDSFRLDKVFTSADFTDGWVQITGTISSMTNLGTGGNGTFDGNLDEVFVGFSNVTGADGSTIEVDFDNMAFLDGALRQIFLPIIMR